MSVKLPQFNLKGEKVGELTTDSVLFSTKVKQGVVHDAYVIATGNQRQGGANTKTRGEVRGGGKKPWKQKGTGRARHGSTRSPIWVGGGITFGPRAEKNFKRKINKSTARAAVRMVLSDRAAQGKVFVLNDWETGGKTKSFAAFLKGAGIAGRSTLVVTPEKQEHVYRSGRNIARVRVLPAQEFNIVPLIEHQYVVVSPETISVFEKLIAK